MRNNMQFILIFTQMLAIFGKHCSYNSFDVMFTRFKNFTIPCLSISKDTKERLLDRLYIHEMESNLPLSLILFGSNDTVSFKVDSLYHFTYRH